MFKGFGMRCAIVKTSIIIGFCISSPGFDLVAQHMVADSAKISSQIQLDRDSAKLSSQIQLENDSAKLSNQIQLEMDAADLINLVTKGPVIVKEEFPKKKSLGPFYTFIPYPGYALVNSYLIGLVSNASFYSHFSDDAKVSSILMSNIYTHYKQFINMLTSNLWLFHDTYNVTGDWRLYRFPTNTFGLGSKTSLNDAVPINYERFRMYEVIMGNISGNFFGGVGVNFESYWNITKTFTSTDSSTYYNIDKYGFPSAYVSSGISLNLQFDDRTNSNNPSKGSFLYVQYIDNLKLLGSTSNWQSLMIDARHYIQLPYKSHNVLALWSFNWLTVSGHPPYMNLPATGEDTYNNTARGYVEGRFRGLNMLYAEAEYRFRILRNGFLGGVIFSNASSVSEWPGNRFEKVNPSNGAGVRIKMNKSASSNLCVDYGFGMGGSRGMSFNLNEVF